MTTLPTGWQFVPLKYLVREAQSGFASGKRDANGTIQVRMNNVTTEGNWDWSKVLRVPASEKQIIKYKLEAGDVLVNITNSPNLVGKTVYFSSSHETLVFSNHFLRLRLKHDKIDPNYLRRWLNVLWNRRVFEGLCTQWVNQASVRKEDLLTLHVPLPPLEEQRRIAAILDKADAVRRKRQQAIALTEELLRSTFLEIFGDPVTNPKEWEIISLGNISKIQGGLQVTSQRNTHPLEAPYLRVANVYRDKLVLDEIKLIRVTQQELERTMLRVGDLLIVEGHGNNREIGRSSVWDGSIPNCTHQNHLIRVRLNSKIANSTYISAFLNSSGGRRQMNKFGKTTSGLNTISTSNVKATKVLLPPLSEQKKYSEIKQKIARCLEIDREHFQSSDNLFNSLLQKAFQGEL